MTFAREEPVKAVRKRHLCVGCLRHIEAGEPATRWTGITDEGFSAVVYHPDCRAAEIALNRLAGNGYCDWWPLNEPDPDDEPFLRSEYPAVAERLFGPTPGGQNHVG